MQSLSVSRERLEQIETDLKDTQSKLSEVLPKLVATREQLQHSLVRAPATGQVVGLTVFTVGGVVAPGQKLMDIVPDGRELVIQAQLKPTDADDAFPGQTAQIRFVSVHNRSLPLFSGQHAFQPFWLPQLTGARRCGKHATGRVGWPARGAASLPSFTPQRPR